MIFGRGCNMKKTISSYMCILVGVILTAAATSLFFTPGKIVIGGVIGIVTVLYHMFNIPPGLSNFVINVVLLLCGWRVLGREFTLKTLVCMVALSLFIQLFSYIPPVTTDPFLSAVAGGVIYGFGVGLTLINAASTGGTDIPVRIIQHFRPHLQFGRIMLFANAVIIAISFAFFREINLAIYGIIGLFISSVSIDRLMRWLNISKLAFIISEDGEKISQKLISTSPRGVTVLKATGAYTGKEKTMLVCALKAKEVPEFQCKVLEIDPGAFVIYSESQQIFGNGFNIYG